MGEINAEIKKAKKLLLTICIVSLLIGSVLIPLIYYANRPYKESDLQNITITVVDRTSVKTGKYYHVSFLADNGKYYYFPDRFRDQLEEPLVGRTVNIWVGESRSSFTEQYVVAWDASGSDVKSGTLKDTNNKKLTDFLFISGIYFAICFLLIAAGLADLFRLTKKRKKLLKKKEDNQQEKLERQAKYGEKFKDFDEDDFSKWSHTQKNTSKKKLKKRKKDSKK